MRDLVVMLITTMILGLKLARVRRIGETLQIYSRTLKRWHQSWLDNFVRSCLWCASQTLPLSLWLNSNKGTKTLAN
jgi:hypothetical protein